MMISQGKFSGFVSVKGARQHNLKNIDVEIPARCAGRFHGRIGIGQILARLRNALCRSSAALSGIRRTLRQASLRPDGHSGSRQHRRSSTRGRSPAAARIADHPFVRRKRDNVVQSASDVVFASGFLSAGPTGTSRRGLFDEQPGRRLSTLPRHRAHLRCDRTDDGPRRFFDDSGTRDRGLAAGLGRSEPARHSGDAWLRRGSSMA